tara:strand:+ start:6749 stop:7405 length:657 start_codon:yes stop_codon:yes gene_type:complete
MNQLVIFDLDNTIIAGDSDKNWGIFLAEENIVDQDYLKQSEEFYEKYSSGNLDIYKFIEFCSQPLIKNSMDQLLSLRNKFIQNKIKPIILDKPKNLIRDHIKNNDKVIIATATNNFVTRPIADLFQVDILISTELEIKDNKFTGKLINSPCFKEGKLEKVNEWANKNSYDLSDATFYSDSFNDLPLLKVVKEPIIVDGDEKIISIANQNNWTCISFRE